MHRLFVALRPSTALRRHCLDAIAGGPPGWAWQREDQLHVTLRFIGEVERPLAEDIARALQAIHADCLDLRVTGVGRFDQRNGGAVWAGVEPRARVAALAAKIDRACQMVGLEAERRVFHPHITLARYGRGSKAEVEPFVRRNAGLTSAPFTVTGFTLLESRLSRHGPHYETVADFLLG